MAENVKCKNCNRLKNHWCEAVIDSPDEDMIRDCQHFSQKTNADRIRAMTDEKLAVYFCRRFLACSSNTCPGTELCVAGGCNANGLLKWLKQPAED